MRLLREDSDANTFLRQIFPTMPCDQLWELTEGDTLRLCECDCIDMAREEPGPPSGYVCGRPARYVNRWERVTSLTLDEIAFRDRCWRVCMHEGQPYAPEDA